LKAVLELRNLPQQARSLQGISKRIEDTTGNVNRLLAIGQIANHLRETILASELRLEPHGFKVSSQNDEDGILKEIFTRIGVSRRTFVEFGVGNGYENNTCYLLGSGWSGIWIDGALENHEFHQLHFGWAIRSGVLKTVQSFLTVENINAVIAEAGTSGEIDLLSIDVDGNDFHLWEAVQVIDPRVVVIEYNAYAAPPIKWVMSYDPLYRWDGESNYFGSSLASLHELGSAKGYTLVACNITGLNAFFVRNDLVEDKFPESDNPLDLYHPRRWWLDAGFISGVIDQSRPFVSGARPRDS
jgi:hypothetical protein